MTAKPEVGLTPLATWSPEDVSGWDGLHHLPQEACPWKVEGGSGSLHSEFSEGKGGSTKFGSFYTYELNLIILV